MSSLWLFSVQNCKSISVSKWEYKRLSSYVLVRLWLQITELLKLAEAEKKGEKRNSGILRWQERHQEPWWNFLNFIYVAFSVETDFRCLKVHTGEYGCPLHSTKFQILVEFKGMFLGLYAQFARGKEVAPVPSQLKCWSLQVKTNLAAGKQPL